MPLLQFDVTGPLDPTDKEAFAAEVTDLYTEEMATTAGHVAVTIRERDPSDLHLGRAEDGRLLFLDAEIRRGRSFERKRAFALATMEAARERWDVPEANLKVVFTEHAGEQMMGYDRVGGEWDVEDGGERD
ncbi:tautomerase family protein [Halomarina litorea]|uniref:tautomerase family protein n=1 Tax=Halomarina litorea TaxID=2961595 RepID=UPI0020C4EEA8|nr:tautomerase [Halomarina sp. BCD28]